MNDTTGGVATAAGLHFQYLATVDAILDWLEDTRDFIITTEDPVDDAIDFSVQVDDSSILLAQAKASVDSERHAPLTAGEIVDHGIRLCKSPSESYLLRTNRELSTSAESLIQVLTAGSDVPGEELRDRLRATLTAPTYRKIAAIDEVLLQRLTRLRVTSTAQSLDDFADKVARRILRLRRHEARGGGRASADALLHYCVAAVLRRSAQRTGRGMTRDDVHAMLGLSARTLAHAIGEYDWGVTTGAFPRIRSAVDRPSLIDQMLARLGSASETRRLRTMVLTGPSGAGKSALAAAFCDLVAQRYDSLHWIDASTDTTLRSQFNTLAAEDLSALTDAEAAAVVRASLERDPAARLIVFDNAPSQSSVMEWLPAHGHVDAVATSTNANGWSHWSSLHVGAMTELEALSLVRSRLQPDSSCTYDDARAVALVRRLDGWPLAIELACAHLGRSGRGLAFAEEYLEQLASRVIDNESLVPSDYHSHPTLLQAILVALDLLQEVDHAAHGLWGTMLLQTLSYLPPRAGLLEVAGPVSIATQLETHPRSIPRPESPAAIAILADEALTRLGEASIVERYRIAGESSDRVRTNAVVLEVVRQLDGGHPQELRISYLHVWLEREIRRAYDDEQFSRVSALEPSATTAVEHALSLGFIIPFAIPTLGNLAQFWQLRGEYAHARSMLRKELAMLDAADQYAPALRAKIYAAMAYSMLHLPVTQAEISDAIEGAINHAEYAVQSPQHSGDMATVGAQVLHILQVLERSTEYNDSTRLRRWRRRLEELTPVEDARARVANEINRSMTDPGTDLADVIRLVDKSLESEQSPYWKVNFLFSKAEAHAAMYDFGLASAVFSEAADQSRQISLGLSPGWTSILNAWQAAAFGLLSAFPPDGVRHFFQELSQIVGDEAPTTPEDRASLAVCRAASAAILDPVREASRLLDAVPNHRATTYTAGPVDLTTHLVSASAIVLRIRNQLAPQEICIAKGWRRIQVGDDISYVLRVDSTTCSYIRAAALPPTPATPARWILSEPGIGLIMNGPVATLVWFFTRETGWVRVPGAPSIPATRELRQRLKQDQFPKARVAIHITDLDLDSDLVDIYASSTLLAAPSTPLHL
ncbi:hypothetical protein HJ588_02365 [Flexivirga sp. ID2601S]|uniref:AAA+ ATPase domain-containing protein n=1 Tax=Flexivirga aerilata TaxID=1656889 RepID=A0A849AEX0_9MICO|nr:hypothetical protein [Flexivirga aerilata]NNG38116.1 hypothetical protein [Flexivirga aerilata]